MNPGLAPVSETCKAEPPPCAERRGVRSRAEAALSDAPGGVGKLGLGDGIRDKFITVFFLMTCSDVPTLLSGIFFLVFYFLKKIDSVSKTLVLNKVIIFYNPLSFFGHDISDF